jgi:hypothetical protein
LLRLCLRLLRRRTAQRLRLLCPRLLRQHIARRLRLLHGRCLLHGLRLRHGLRLLRRRASPWRALDLPLRFPRTLCHLLLTAPLAPLTFPVARLRAEHPVLARVAAFARECRGRARND